MESELGLVPGAQVYRLLVTLDHEEVIFAAPLFRDFKEARGQVGAAICRHAQSGVVRRVVLQGGTPVPLANAVPDRFEAPSSASVPVFRWRDVAAWDGEVVARVLAQRHLAVQFGAGATMATRALPPAARGAARTRALGPSAAAPRGSSALSDAAAGEIASAAAPGRPALPSRPSHLVLGPPHRPIPAPAAARPHGSGSNGHGTRAAGVSDASAAMASPAPNRQTVHGESAVAVSPAKLPVATDDGGRQLAPHRHARSRYRRNGWRMVVVSALLIVSWLGIAYLQSGESPLQVLRGAGASQPAMANELPFEAPQRWRPGASGGTSQPVATRGAAQPAKAASQPVVRPTSQPGTGAHPSMDRP